MTRSFRVESPSTLPAAPGELGRLGPFLRRLAAMQGGWPPVRPARVVRPDPMRGVEQGAVHADALVDSGADLVVAGGPELPPGGLARVDADPTHALATLAALLDLEPVAVVGTSQTPDWAARISAVRDGLRAARAHRTDPEAMLAALGADRVAGLAGLLAQCAVRRTPVLLSGAPEVCAAVLVAARLAPGAVSWLLAGCSPAMDAARTALTERGLEPLLDLRIDHPHTVDLALAVLLGGIELARPDQADPTIAAANEAAVPDADEPAVPDADEPAVPDADEPARLSPDPAGA